MVVIKLAYWLLKLPGKYLALVGAGWGCWVTGRQELHEVQRCMLSVWVHYVSWAPVDVGCCRASSWLKNSKVKNHNRKGFPWELQA